MEWVRPSTMSPQVQMSRATNRVPDLENGTMGCQERAFYDCTRQLMGCLGEEPRVGKREIKAVGRVGKQREKETKWAALV